MSTNLDASYGSCPGGLLLTGGAWWEEPTALSYATSNRYTDLQHYSRANVRVSHVYEAPFVYALIAPGPDIYYTEFAHDNYKPLTRTLRFHRPRHTHAFTLYVESPSGDPEDAGVCRTKALTVNCTHTPKDWRKHVCICKRLRNWIERGSTRRQCSCETHKLRRQQQSKGENGTIIHSSCCLCFYIHSSFVGLVVLLSVVRIAGTKCPKSDVWFFGLELPNLQSLGQTQRFPVLFNFVT